MAETEEHEFESTEAAWQELLDAARLTQHFCRAVAAAARERGAGAVPHRVDTGHLRFLPAGRTADQAAHRTETAQAEIGAAQSGGRRAAFARAGVTTGIEEVHPWQGSAGRARKRIQARWRKNGRPKNGRPKNGRPKRQTPQEQIYRAVGAGNVDHLQYQQRPQQVSGRSDSGAAKESRTGAANEQRQRSARPVHARHHLHNDDVLTTRANDARRPGRAHGRCGEEAGTQENAAGRKNPRRAAEAP